MRLFNASEQSETRTLTRIGSVFVLSVVLATVLYLVGNPFGRGSRNTISVAIDTPFVGQGVAVGTPVIMHGVKIGQVVSVSSISGGGVRLKTDLQQGLSSGLTDAMGIDYRPSNYFGVTGINVVPALSGRPLQSGMQISLIPRGNFSLQALLYRLGELSTGVFNQRLISVIERATRYFDGLNPLLETALIVGTSVADVQTVSTERLLRNTAGLSVAFPGFIDALVSAGNNFVHTWFGDVNPFGKGNDNANLHNVFYPALDARGKQIVDEYNRFLQDNKATDVYEDKSLRPYFNTAITDLFAPIGYLESSHINDLLPILESVRTLADAVPKIISPDSFADTITELRQRFERMYAGSGEERALQVRITLDRLPGIAAPLGVSTNGSR
jgi:hypothetical protein